MAQTLQQLQDELTKWEAARDSALEAGQKYALPGGRTREAVSIEVTVRRIDVLRRKIAEATGQAPAGGVVRFNPTSPLQPSPAHPRGQVL